MATAVRHRADRDRTGHDRTDRVWVTCPQTGTPWLVQVAQDIERELRVTGCSRFWGELCCDAPCTAEAIAVVEEEAAKQPPIYCGHPNFAAPRPRES